MAFYTEMKIFVLLLRSALRLCMGFDLISDEVDF